MSKPLRHWIGPTQQGNHIELQTQFFRIATPAYIAWLGEQTGRGWYEDLYRRMLAVKPPEEYATIGQAIWTAFKLLANDPPMPGTQEDREIREQLGYDIIQGLLVDALRDTSRRPLDEVRKGAVKKLEQAKAENR